MNVNTTIVEDIRTHQDEAGQKAYEKKCELNEEECNDRRQWKMDVERRRGMLQTENIYVCKSCRI
jgi:hypothetical protein